MYTHTHTHTPSHPQSQTYLETNHDKEWVLHKSTMNLLMYRNIIIIAIISSIHAYNYKLTSVL